MISLPTFCFAVSVHVNSEIDATKKLQKYIARVFRSMARIFKEHPQKVSTTNCSEISDRGWLARH